MLLEEINEKDRFMDIEIHWWFIILEVIELYQSFLLLCSSSLHCWQFSGTFLHVSLPHRPELRKQLQIGLPIFVEVLLDHQSSLIKTPSLHIKNAMTQLKIFDSLLVPVHHHQTTSDVVLKNSVIYRLNLKANSIYSPGFLKAT